MYPEVTDVKNLSHRELFMRTVRGNRILFAKKKYNCFFLLFIFDPILHTNKQLTKQKTLQFITCDISIYKGHKNWLENNTQFILALLANLIVLRNYYTTLVLGVLVLISRWLYGWCYSRSPALREPPFLVATLCGGALHGTLIWFVVQRLYIDA
jgi:uncharacterized MAPEG superfamily protein